MNLRPGIVFPSVTDQHPNPYWTFDDKWPQYIQVQRTEAKITGNKVTWNVNAFDPNLFMRSKAYMKLKIRIGKKEIIIDEKSGDEEIKTSDFSPQDRIYKKPGMVLHNACTDADLRLNSHTMSYKDLRYITKKLNTSFAGKTINNTYLTTSGGPYEDYDGVYDRWGNIFSNTVPPDVETRSIDLQDMGFSSTLGTENTIEFSAASQDIVFGTGAGPVVNLFTTQLFRNGDVLTLSGGRQFRVIATLNDVAIFVEDINGGGDIGVRDLSSVDTLLRLVEQSFDGDSGRQQAYDDAFRDATINSSNTSYAFTEPLCIGPWNHLSDYSSDQIAKNAWNNKQSKLIPYIREIELSMTFKDIAANALIYAYGNNATPNAQGISSTVNQLIDIEITSAQLVLFWVKPRDSLLLTIPETVRIQSWTYEHKQFPLFNFNFPDVPIISDGVAATSSINNIYTSQQPSYILYYGMVDKDSNGYKCRSLVSSFDYQTNATTISADINAVESGMHPVRQSDINADLLIRSNTLGGDNILDNAYNIKELTRITLKNSTSDFPWGETKFRGLQQGEALFATYPSEWYLLLGEAELNSFFIRKGQLQTSNVMDFQSTLVATDGYSLSKAITGIVSNKKYILHIFYIYDRFFIELSNDGTIDSRFDALYL